MLHVNSWAWWCGCSLTAGPAACSPALPPPTASMCAREGARHVTAACLGVRAQRPADHHRPAVVVSSGSLEQMSGSKTSPHIRPQQAQRLMNPSASLCFPMFNHLFGSDLCSLPVFHSLPLQSFYLTGADEARHAQLFGWMMYH